MDESSHERAANQGAFEGWKELQNSKYPGLITTSRVEVGGLSLGFQFSENETLPDLVDVFHQAGLMNVLVIQYLYSGHQISAQVHPTQANTIFISLDSVEQVEHVLNVLAELCKLLWSGRLLELTKFLWQSKFTEEELKTISRPYKKKIARKSERPIAFLSHIVEERLLRFIDPMFRVMSEASRRHFIDNYAPLAAPASYAESSFEDLKGQDCHLSFIGSFLTSDYFLKSLNAKDDSALNLTRRMLLLAKNKGCELIGLGQFTSIVTDNGVLVKDLGVPVTTGNSLTSMSAVAALNRDLEISQKDPGKLSLGVIGATGNIGGFLADVLIKDYKETTIFYHTELNESPRMQTRLSELNALTSKPIQVTTDFSELQHCDVVVVATNAVDSIVPVEHLKTGAWVLDLSVPQNVERKKMAERQAQGWSGRLLTGGLLKLPKDQSLNNHWIPTPKSQVFACIAETILLGWSGRFDLASVGKLELAKAQELWKLALESGFELGKVKA